MNEDRSELKIEKEEFNDFNGEFNMRKTKKVDSHEIIKLNNEIISYDQAGTCEYTSLENMNKLYLEDDSSVLITSAFHMKRALIISKEYEINLIPYAVDYKSISSNSPINIYQDFNVVSNLSSFNLLFREILGIIVFKIFY